MTKMAGYFCIRTFAVLLFVSSTLGDNLVARRLNTSLPSPSFMMAPYYDGESDFIYLVGGAGDNSNLDSILRFDISRETIEEIETLPVKSWASPLEADSAGNLVYFDGINPPYKIYNFNIINDTIKVVAESSFWPVNSASTKDPAGKVLLFGGGLGIDIWKYDVGSESVNSEIVGQLPASFLSATAAKISNNKVLLFGTAAGGSIPYIELDLETLETKEVAVNSFPGFQDGMTVTGDNEHVYLFGGNLTTAGLPLDGIVQLDPITHSWNCIQVQNFPVVSDYFFRYAPEVVLVEKLNRIYMFGGALDNNGDYLFLNDIYYIDLYPLNPTTTLPTVPTSEDPSSTTFDPNIFSCGDRNDGTYPHPYDCSKYVGCRNGTLEGVHPCPPPLLFDPVTSNCNLPSLVDCDLSCENKVDGTYPHPHDCSLFIICSNRDIFVFWCDPPLLFDPQELRCDLPDLVQCANS